MSETRKGIPLMSLNDVADITQVNKSFNKIDELLDDTKKIDEHARKRIVSEEGVHGFRFNEDTEEFEKLNNSNEWESIGGVGGGVSKLPPVKNIKIIPKNKSLGITWEDPDDTNWVGTKVVYKIGSYPQNPTDGTLVVDNKEKNKYKNNEISANSLTNGTRYFFTFFPYDRKGKFNNDAKNLAEGVPQGFRFMTITKQINNSNPERSLNYEGDATNMSPGSNDWDTFFGHFPCLFKDGKIVGKLKRDDRTKFEDGSPADITSGNSGDVMIAFPKRNLKIETTTSGLKVVMTDDLSTSGGFETNAHLRGTKTKEYFYIGAYLGSLQNGKLRSLSGQTPYTNITIGEARACAQRNGTGYDQLAFYQLIYLQAMYLLKYKNLNSQQVIGKGYTGGNAGLIKTGGTEQRPMDWGESSGRNHMILFGIEDFWGNGVQWVEGLYCDKNRNIVTTTENFNDSATGYYYRTNIGTTNINGFISDVQGETKTGFIIKNGGASGTTHFCDFGAVHATSFPYFGGDYGDVDSVAGAFCLRINVASGIFKQSFGARLMYL